MIWPLVGRSKPAIIRSVVVLPHPDGPSRVKNSPAGMSRSMPATATCSPNFFVSPSSWIAPGIGLDLHGGERRGLLAAGEPAVDEEGGDQGQQRDRQPDGG